LASINQIMDGADESVGNDDWAGVGEPFSETLRSLSSLLSHSTVGVALYDKSLHCRALNGALARMNGVSVSGSIGKAMHQIFPKQAPLMEPAFQRAWATGNSISNVELKVQFPAKREVRRWLVNFYPIKDESRQVRLVATTFSEVTKRSSVESQLCRLTDQFRGDVLGEPSPFGEEFAEMSARTLELVRRSVALLKSSMSLRCYASETRMATGLVRLTLFLTGTRDQEPMLQPAWPQGECDAGASWHSDRVAPNEHELPGSCPSPRERQVLYLLADGKSNKEIGTVLDISTRTVESYRARIMLKLDLHSTAALVRYAVRNNIVEP
jgi:DNA-binding CsgD family transcriptional regulator